MNGIKTTEQRISAALDRIGAALGQAAGRGDTVPPAVLAEAQAARQEVEREADLARSEATTALQEIERLRQALEAETVANSQLRERVAVLKDKKDAQAEEIARIDAERERIAGERVEDREELDALISALEPLVEDHSHA
ncbi:MAG: hypothetical protein AAFR47_14945 [Pseudomonadota bacterium]